MKARLMAVERDAILAQKDTRVPETRIRVPLCEIAQVRLDTGPSTGQIMALYAATRVVVTAGAGFLFLALVGGG